MALVAVQEMLQNRFRNAYLKARDISLLCPTPNKRLPLTRPVYHLPTQGRGDTNTPINQRSIKESDTCWAIFSEREMLFYPFMQPCLQSPTFGFGLRTI